MIDAPNSATAEAALLGALLMVGGRQMVDALVRDYNLAPEDFYDARHERVYRAILSIVDSDDAISPVVVAQHLNAQVDDLLAVAAPPSEAMSLARLLKRLALRRTWRSAGMTLMDAAASDDEDLVALAERALTNPTVSEDTSSADSIGHELVEWLADTSSVGISTGFLELDVMLGGGLRPGDTTALGAWTGMGKSALVDQILTGSSLAGYRCHAYINEMSRVDRGLRMIARSGAVPYSRLVRRDLSGDGDWNRAMTAASNIPFGLSEVAQWGADRIARHIRANKWDLCVFDHLHNMAYVNVATLDSIIANLANAARSSGAHLILVCQFNQERAKQEQLPMPVMRDIRGSGMLANQCASVLLLHREQASVNGIVLTTNDAIIKADKARHGIPGSVFAEFHPDSMSFWPQAPGARA